MNQNNNIYRKIEAMYHTNKTSDEIARELRVSKWEVLEIMQNIFGKEMVRREQRRTQS